MIGLKIKFVEGSIVSALQNKHYLLEAIVETELEPKPINLLLLDAAKVNTVPAARKTAIAVLRTFIPVEIIKFVGMRKNSAEWWVANLRLESVVPSTEKETSFLLVGWSSKKFDTKAVMVRKGGVSIISDDLEARVSEKIEKGYIQEASFDNIELKTGVIDLPNIPGLPDISEKKKTTFADIFASPDRESPDSITEDPDFEDDPEPGLVIELSSSSDPLEEISSAAKAVLGCSDPSEVDVLDPSFSFDDAKKIIKTKKNKKEEKKNKVLEMMKQRKRESEW